MKKETKEFFAQDNRLNKGYSNASVKESDKSFFRKRFEHLFPPSDVLQVFEDLNEGSVDRIISMAEQEQVHRKALEETKTVIFERVARISLLAEVFIMSIICFTVISLVKAGSVFVAIFFIACVFLTKFLIYRRKFDTQSRRKFSNFEKDNSKAYKR